MEVFAECEAHAFGGLFGGDVHDHEAVLQVDGSESVHHAPGLERAEVGVGVADALFFHAIGNGGEQEFVRVAAVFPEHVFLDHVHGRGEDEHEVVVLRVGDGEIEVGSAECFEALERITDLAQRREFFREQVEGFALHLVEEFVLVLVIEVNGGRAVLDLIGDGADGGTLVAYFHEHLKRRVDDLPPHFLLFPFLPFCDAHGLVS